MHGDSRILRSSELGFNALFLNRNFACQPTPPLKIALQFCKEGTKTKMKNNKNQQILIGGAVVFRDNRGKKQFLLVKQKEGDGWEIPKVTVRRGESSARAVIRLTSEQGGMTARILEEAGRSNGTSFINGKSIPQKHYYYLMLQKGASGEMIGFNDFKWMEFGIATKAISQKKEQEVLKSAADVLKEWEKTHNRKQMEF